jgi:hypothetical protein
MTPEWMYRFGERLLEVTHDCRPDMHEPDEQGVSAVVTGLDLDNAMGDSPYTNFQELTVGIEREDTDRMEWFNLASLIALARIGARHLAEEREVRS